MANTKPKNIRLDEKMDAKLHQAVKDSGMPLADIMRVALSLGLKDLELMNYDIDGAIYDRVMLEKAKLKQSEHPQLKVANKPMGNESSPSTRADSVVYPQKKRRKSG